MNTLQELFTHFVKDMYYAEKQILKDLPKMAQKAESEQLRQALEKHREETEGQVQRLEKVFELCGVKPAGTTCEAIDGLLEEGHEVMESADSPGLRDVGMIAAAQAVEHYEISRYGTLIAWAERLGMNDAVDLLKETLEQEKATDKKLTELAVGSLNKQAAA
jgi:ferritin-like metal-binding protein YciE